MEDSIISKINDRMRGSWEQFYSAYFRKIDNQGRELMVLCPFHPDKTASMSIDPENGLWKCHACGESGNPQTFLQKHKGLTAAEAIKTLQKEAGVYVDEQKAQTYTLQDYARDKNLPVEYLKELGIIDRKPGIIIPYYDETGTVVAKRNRARNHLFSWVRGTKVCMYGLWKLTEMKPKGYMVLVEGESDSQTLWLHDEPALGIPGASTFNAEWVKYLRDIPILYLVKEPDTGGETFIQRICDTLVEQQWQGEVRLITLGKYKDPSEMYCADTGNFKAIWNVVLSSSEPLDIISMSIKTDETLQGAPISLRRPDFYRYDENGIFFINEKGMSRQVFPVPVLITRKLRNAEANEVKVEIAYLNETRKWEKIVCSGMNLFSKSKITMFRDYGLLVSSENASELIKFLAALETKNISLIPFSNYVEKLGWLTVGKRFIPGAADGVILDAEGGSRALWECYSEEGNYDTWKAEIGLLRAKSPISRLMIAGAFAAPLVRLLSQRVSVVHIYGDTRGGKTAALKAALSVWGEPEGLMANFNATKVGLERLAGFYNDLPLGIDERQVAGNKQEFVDYLVYLLGLGKGKARGSKGGGLQHFSSWRCLVLSTGEEPLTTESSHGGLYSRVLEVYGVPISDEKHAVRIHQMCNIHYGHAGPDFIKRLIQLQKDHPDVLKSKYNYFYNVIENSESLGSHKTCVSTLMVADYFASLWIWEREEEDANAEAIAMGKYVIDKLDTVTSADLSMRAYDFTTGWINAHMDRFNGKGAPPHLGIQDEGCYYLIPSFYEAALREQGFSPKRVYQDFAREGFIRVEKNGEKKSYKVKKRWHSQDTRMICFKYGEHQSPEGPAQPTILLANDDDTDELF